MREIVKQRPVCPVCGAEMKPVGTKNRGDKTPVRIFQCMEVGCSNRRRYNRSGQEMW